MDCQLTTAIPARSEMCLTRRKPVRCAIMTPENHPETDATEHHFHAFVNKGIDQTSGQRVYGCSHVSKDGKQCNAKLII